LKTLKIISAFALAALTLLGSTTFVVGIHHCNGEVKGLAIFGQAEGCKHQLPSNLPECHKHVAKDCCNDITVLHEGCAVEDHTFEIAVNSSVDLEPIVDAILIAEVTPSITSSFSYTEPDDPVLAQDRSILFSTLLV